MEGLYEVSGTILIRVGICDMTACRPAAIRFALWLLSHYLRVVPPTLKKLRPKKPTAAKLRSWRVSVLRSRAHYHR